MSETKHTPGPWIAHGFGSDDDYIRTGTPGDASWPGDPVAIVGDWRWTKEQKAANAARIVACVNACEGIEDPTTLRSQRDALLARDAGGGLRWTRVEDGLPGEERVLACNRRTKQYRLVVYGHEDEFGEGVGWYARGRDGWMEKLDFEATHWMPLPDPPTEES